MGAGKTTVGMYLARKLEVGFVDSDREIEAQAGYPVSEIFERDGEAFFRKVEAKTIREILEKSDAPCVLATGGGAFMNPETRAVILGKSTCIWLRSDIATLVDRLENTTTRPLLANVNKHEMLTKLIGERYPVYEQAHIIVDTDSNSRTIITNEIMNKLENCEKTES